LSIPGFPDQDQPPADAQQELAAHQSALVSLSETLEAAQAAIERGDVVDLSGLDAALAERCQAILRLDPALARQTLLPALDRLSERLETLEAALRRQGPAQGLEPTPATRRVQAAEVYGRSRPPRSGTP